MVDFFYKERYGFNDLVDIMRILRSDEGCPWDREQTHESVRQNLLEEAYEAAEAIDLNDPELLCEELGDVLLQVVFHARMSEESGDFDISEICDGVCKKLIVRHPHIFGEEKADTSAEVLVNWDNIKRQTKGHTTHAEAIESIARSLPALIRAEKVQKKAAKAGFGRQDIESAWDKLDELVAGLKKDLSAEGAEERLGDILFTAVKVARLLGIDPERALEKTTDRFTEGFAKVERLASEEGLPMPGTSPEKLDELWERVKKQP